MSFGKRTDGSPIPDRYKRDFLVEVSYTYKNNPAIHFESVEVRSAGAAGALTEVVRSLNQRHNYDIDPFRVSVFDKAHDTKKKLKVIDNPDYSG